MKRTAVSVQLLLLLLICTRSAAQWTTLSLNTTEDLWGLQYDSDGTVWIGAVDTMHYSTDNGGAFLKKPTWSPPGSGVPIFGLYTAIHAFNADELVITGTMNSGQAESIYRSTDGGTGYDLVHFYPDPGPLDILRDITFAQAPMGMVVGSNGRILRSTDSGGSWTPMVSGTPGYLTNLAHASGSTYLTAGPSVLLRSTDGGISWSVVPGSDGLQHLTCAGATCFGSGTSTVVKSVDAGATWVLSGSLAGESIQAMAQLDATTIIVSTTTGMFRSTSSGQYWERFDLPDFEWVRRIQFYDASHGIAVGDNGFAIRTGNSGGNAVPVASIEGPVTATCTNANVTFQNLGDPAWTYQWLVNGAPTTTSYDLVTSFADAGAYTVQVVAFNGFGHDTASVSVDVQPVVEVPPFNATAESDSVCPNTSTYIQIPLSTPGVTYRLYNGTVQIGSGQGGNGASLTFSTGDLPASDTLTAIGIKANACFVDSFAVDVFIHVLSIGPSTTFSLERDSICGGNTQILVSGAPANTWFRFYSNPSIFVAQWTPVADGVAVLEMEGSLSVGTYTFTVAGYYGGNSGCPFTLAGMDTLHVVGASAGFVLDPPLLVVGQEAQIINSSFGFDHQQWSFGADASPLTWTGPAPPPVSYGSPGERIILLEAVLGDSVCAEQVEVTVAVFAPAPVEVFPVCGEGTTTGDYFVQDLHLDQHNNRYITGRYVGQVPNNSELFVVKADSLGQVIWEFRHPHTSGITASSIGLGITADQEGNAYVTVNAPNADPYVIQGNTFYSHQFVFKFDLEGTFQWAIESENTRFKDIAVSTGNVIHVTGITFDDATALMPGGGEVSLNGGDGIEGTAFVLAFTTEGAFVDANRFGRTHYTFNPNDYENADMQIDIFENPWWNHPFISFLPDGDLLVSGLIDGRYGSIEHVFDTVVLRNNATPVDCCIEAEIFAARLDPQLEVVDAVSMMGGDDVILKSVMRGPDGSFVMCGGFDGGLCVGDSVLDYTLGYGFNNYPRHAFIAKADSTGEVQWHTASRYTDIYEAVPAMDGSILALGAVHGTGALMDAAGIPHGIHCPAAYGRAYVRFGSDGDVLGVDVSTDTTVNVALHARMDDCGAFHVVELNKLYDNTTIYSGSIYCDVENDCDANVHLRIIGEGGCGPDCAVDDFNVGVPQVRSPRGSLLIYPDPTTGPITVRLPVGVPAIGQLRISDPSGRIVRSLPCTAMDGTLLFDGSLDPGTYALMLETRDGRRLSASFVVTGP